MLAVAASLAGAAPASAETFTVTGFGDGSSPCAGTACPTLRSAITATNASAGLDAILLGAGTYSVPSGALTITEEVNISGVGPRATTIDAAGSGDRVFVVSSPTQSSLGLLTVRGGFSSTNGGNILVTAGANLGLAFVRVTGGAATQGGGIANQGDLAVTFSTIDGNNATAVGGGIDNQGTTGGAELVVGNSTVASNYAAEGGGISSRGASNSVDFLHVTLARNTGGGGIWFQEQQQNLSIASIVAANGTTNCTGPGNFDETFNSGNIDSDGTCELAPGTNLVADPLVAGALSYQGGATATDVLAIPANSPAVGYVSPCSPLPDQRGWTRPAGGACSAGAYDPLATDPGGGGTQPPPTPTPVPPAQPTPTPTPVVNQTAVAREQRGTVKVQLPGSKTFIDLDATRGIPMGSTIDTRKGAVEITTTPKAGAPPEKATFYDGLFKLTQRAGITNLTLVEELDCKQAKRASASQKGRKPKKRKLWGDGKGSFRTTGRYSAATVRGTKWLVEDTCTTTTTSVKQGSVTVQHGKKRIVVRAGKRYVARAKK